jgi:predicted metalloprotease with PDZ domain
VKDNNIMTEATQLRPVAPFRTSLEICYQVAMPQPTSHLFEVTLQVKGWESDRLDLKMPVWTPGSYLIREYARHLQDFEAKQLFAPDKPLIWRKLSKNHWQVETAGVSDLTLSYRIFANELTVRTNHLDPTHGYFNPAALCFYLPGFERYPIQIAIVPPNPNWQVSTPLPSVAERPYTFTAADFDTLVDSPFEIGKHQIYDFEVMGKPHQWAIWGEGKLDMEAVIADTTRIIQVEADLFGGLPYDRYLFLLHLSSQGFGGLEHKNACTLNYSRFGLSSEDKYYRFMQLVAHEFFHLWNIKRIRPQALERFDYDQENYTPSLWFSEGTTSYYDLLMPFRAGIYDAKNFLSALSKEMTRFLVTPGRQVQPLSESSFDAWIKLYRRDANSDNSQMSYYLKGEMVSLLLDLLIRSRHQNQRSLDDVMRLMWQQFGQDEIGFTPEQLQQAIAKVAETDLTAFFHHCLETTQDLLFDQYLEPFGLQLQAEDVTTLPPALGMMVKSEQGRELVKFVEYNSPAQQAGIDAGDDLLAIDGLRVTADQLGDRLKHYQPNDVIEITIFHQDQLRTCSVKLSIPSPTRYQLVAIPNPSLSQQQQFSGWLHVTIASIK